MIYLNEIEVGSQFFPNGELNLLNLNVAVKNASVTRGEYFHTITMKYVDDKDLMTLYFVKKFLDSATNGERVELLISYMPYSRMDRAETPETPFMLKYVTDFINNLEFYKVEVYEPHSQVTVDLLNYVIPIYANEYLIDEVKELEHFDDELDYIVFPDDGARQRYTGKIESNNILIGHKTRDFESGKITGLNIAGDGNIKEGARAIIVDDLSSFGRTFNEASKRLRELGFERVVLLVFHAENSIFKGELFNHLDHIYTTNSILTEMNHWENQQFNSKLTVFEF